MPSHNLHKKISKAAFGSEGKDIHKAIDSGYNIFGSKHRKYPPHDLFSSLAIGYMKDGKRGASIAALHLISDEIFKGGGKNGRRRKGR